MRIGIICHDAFPIAQPYQGGLEMITSLIVRELHSRGHEVSSLCLEGSDLPGEHYYYTKNETSKAVKDELEELGQVSAALNQFLQKDFDIVQNHSLHYQSIILGNVSCHNFVTTFHTPIFPYLKIAIDAVAHSVGQTFTGVSTSLGNLYMENLPEVETIYNGIDLSIWTPNFKKQDTNYYSWSGRLCKEKGLDKILKLCVEHNLNLKIAGPISNPEYFASLIEPYLSYNHIEYVGHLNQQELNNFIKNSKGFIFSSIWEEPYGLVIAEALACGVPVLANNVGAAGEIIDKHSGYLYNINDASSFLRGLAHINTLSRHNCRSRAESFCCHKKMVDNYEHLYAQMMTKNLLNAI